MCLPGEKIFLLVYLAGSMVLLFERKSMLLTDFEDTAISVGVCHSTQIIVRSDGASGFTFQTFCSHMQSLALCILPASRH